MKRIDKGSAVILSVALLVLAGLVWKGPAEQKTVAATALFGLIGMVGTAMRGRLLKRDRSQFGKDDKS